MFVYIVIGDSLEYYLRTITTHSGPTSHASFYLDNSLASVTLADGTQERTRIVHAHRLARCNLTIGLP